MLGSADPAVRAAGIAVARSVGARYARIPVAWTLVARNETFTRPDEAAVPLSDPSHPVYDWARLDAALRDLAAADLTPIAYFMAAPPWAMSAPRYAYSAPGTWAPRPADLGALTSAVARRYDGTFPDPLAPGRTLPRVAHFQTWNEPNLARYLQPQWVPVDGRPSLFSARWYRGMHAAAYAAIHARQPDAVVALAGLAPTGDDEDGNARVSPMRFLRSLLCTDGDARRCGAPLPFDAIALHPLSTGDPDRPATRPDDIAVADLRPKLDELLARARRAGRLRAGADPALWITELNWTSADAGGVPAAQQEPVVGRAMMRLAQAGAALVNWQFATDPPLSRTAGLVRPAGLTLPVPGDARGLPGAPKRFFGGFAFSVAAIAVGSGHAYVWAQAPGTVAGSGTRTGRGSVAPPPATRTGRWTVAPPATRTGRGTGAARGRAVVERRSGSSWRVVAEVRVAADGIVSSLISVPRGAILRLRIGAATSPAVRVELRLGRIRPGAAPADPLPAGRSAAPSDPLLASRAVAPADPLLAGRAQAPASPRDGRQADDRRPFDLDGPGFFPPLRPVAPGGTPPALRGGPVAPVAAPAQAPRRLPFQGTSGADVIVGSSGADRLIGGAGADLLIGLGGDDRFAPGTGRDTVVRKRVAGPR